MVAVHQNARRDFTRKLREQLDYIQASCQAYDDGNASEAVRVAISLRIIFYNKGKSVSLLAHLGSPSIKIMSVAEDIDRPDRFFAGLTTLRIHPTALQQEFMPKLGAASVKRIVPVDQWWEQDIVFQDPNKRFTINRKDLVLAAANKDGGAHVDAMLNERYQFIEQGAGWSMNVNPPNGSSIVVRATNGHLASLRQMGWEALHSPELLRLSRKGRA